MHDQLYPANSKDRLGMTLAAINQLSYMVSIQLYNEASSLPGRAGRK